MFERWCGAHGILGVECLLVEMGTWGMEGLRAGRRELPLVKRGDLLGFERRTGHGLV